MFCWRWWCARWFWLRAICFRQRNRLWLLRHRMMADRETATPVGTEELFFGEVSGFTPPPPMGGGGSIAPATTRQAGDGDDTSVHEPSPTLVSRYHGPWSPEERIVESDTIARARLRSAYVGAAYSHEQGGERYYRPVVEFIYEVAEYLRGVAATK